MSRNLIKTLLFWRFELSMITTYDDLTIGRRRKKTKINFIISNKTQQTCYQREKKIQLKKCPWNIYFYRRLPEWNCDMVFLCHTTRARCQTITFCVSQQSVMAWHRLVWRRGVANGDPCHSSKRILLWLSIPLICFHQLTKWNNIVSSWFHTI